IFLERETRQLQGLELSDLNVDAIGTISWVSAIFSSHRTRDIPPLEGRLTAVLKGTGHAWVLVHLHLSYPSLSPKKTP
ncbi:MAG: nuclear transport factor 2 family protein, partial [Methanolinea sp.]|nr:nuclear transport factor 2 family protein [Methanolinea sp.]